MHACISSILAGLLLSSALGVCAYGDSIKLADGSSVEGQVTDYDGDKQILTVRTADGELLALPLAKLNVRTVYKLNNSIVPKDNGRGQLKLANYARDSQLFAHSARHYRQALEADPSLQAEVDEQMVVLRQQAAQYCMDQAKADVAKGDISGAEKWLETLILKLPDEPQAAQAKQILEQHYRKVREARDDAVEAANSELYEKGLAKARKHYDAMVEATQKGLTSKKVDSISLSTWSRAIKDGQAALKELDKLAAAAPDAQSLEQIGVYRGIVIGQMVELHLHRSSYYAVASSYNKALTEVNQALALDPQNAQALTMRSRIMESSSRGVRWLW